MPALAPDATPVRESDSALVRILEASIETLKAENEILRRRLTAAEARAARETAKAEGAIAELSALTRLRARAAALGDERPEPIPAQKPPVASVGPPDAPQPRLADRLDARAAARARPWWRRLVG